MGMCENVAAAAAVGRVESRHLTVVMPSHLIGTHDFFLIWDFTHSFGSVLLLVHTPSRRHASWMPPGPHVSDSQQEVQSDRTSEGSLVQVSLLFVCFFVSDLYIQRCSVFPLSRDTLRQNVTQTVIT